VNATTYFTYRAASLRFDCRSSVGNEGMGAENGNEGKRWFPSRERKTATTPQDLSRRAVVLLDDSRKRAQGEGIKYPGIPGTYRAENYK